MGPKDTHILLDLELCPYLDSGSLNALIGLVQRVGPGGWVGVVSPPIWCCAFSDWRASPAASPFESSRLSTRRARPPAPPSTNESTSACRVYQHHSKQKEALMTKKRWEDFRLAREPASSCSPLRRSAYSRRPSGILPPRRKRGARRQTRMDRPGLRRQLRSDRWPTSPSGAREAVIACLAARGCDVEMRRAGRAALAWVAQFLGHHVHEGLTLR